MKVRSRLWLACAAALTWLARPFRWLKHKVSPPVQVTDVVWADANQEQARTAIERLEALIDRKGHRALGLPTPPSDPRERRRWLVKMARKLSR